MKAPPFAKGIGTIFGLPAILTLGLAWADEPPAKAKPLFDGKSFAGWDGDTKVETEQESLRLCRRIDASSAAP